MWGYWQEYDTFWSRQIEWLSDSHSDLDKLSDKIYLLVILSVLH